jgi:Bacteriophage tail sheath protein
VTTWLNPHFNIEELPAHPIPIRAGDSAWKQVDARRLPAYVERSIDNGLGWVVFERNDKHTWALVREQVVEFLTHLWRDNRLVGTTPEEAFFVKVDRTTMTQDDLDNGRLIVVVGIAPLRPAEFVVFRIGMWTGLSDD